MSEESKRLFLLDGMVLIFRSHFAFSRNPRITNQGKNVSIPYGFTSTLVKILEKEKPTHIAVVFDTTGPTQRHLIFPDYKGHRDNAPEELDTAIPDVDQILGAFNIPVYRLGGYEADDLIGTIAIEAEKEKFETYLVTTDKDFAQLVTDTTYLYRLSSRSDAEEIMGVEQIKEKWKVQRPEQVIDILSLWGDSSDNIPGVTGIGEKTAQKLLAQFDNLENLLKNTDQLKGKQRENLENESGVAKLSKQLATIDCEVPFEFNFEDMRRRSPDITRLNDIFIEFEFNQLGKRVFGDLFDQQKDAAKAEFLQTINDIEVNYQLAETADERSNLINLLSQQSAFCFDCETTSLDKKNAQLVGLAFSFDAQTGFFVPLPIDRYECKSVLDEFQTLFEDTGIEKVGQNLKYDLTVLRWYGIEAKGPFFDTMIAHQLIAPHLRHGMDFLAETYLKYSPIPIHALIGDKKDQQRSIREVALDELMTYAIEDADITWQLRSVFAQLLTELQLEQVFYQVECPTIPVLAALEFNGIKTDSIALSDYSLELSQEIMNLERKIYDLAGTRFNLDSPKQVGQILFEELQLESDPGKTKTGQYKTDVKVLERLASNHLIAQHMLDFRACRKLKNTYVDQLPASIFQPTGRIHTTYEQAFTTTGRVQSHSPNLQNIPIRTDRGKEIRRAFISKDHNHSILSVDYSQIELRIIAELSQDQALISAFESNLDIHTETAARIFDVPFDQVDSEMRRRAKMVNYGIVYGISPFGLSQRLTIPRGEAVEIIDQYFKQFPGVPIYIEETVEFARRYGYVQTMTGRRRYLPDIQSQNATMRNGAERNAVNSPIQGSAADLIKLAMSSIYQSISKRNLKTQMILQVHDELLFDLHKDEQDIVIPLIVKKMKTALSMSVPIEVEIGIGCNWLEAH